MERQSQRQRHSRHTEIESGFVPFLILIDKKIQRMYHSGHWVSQTNLERRKHRGT